MGNKEAQTYNPNTANMGATNNLNTNQQKGSQNQNQNKTKENEQMLLFIRDAFRNCSTNGQLTKDKFNQALSILQALRFKRLRDTPLADRLFSIFDKTHSGLISQHEFINGITEIISEKENAINYTFLVYDRDGDKMISRKQFMLFVEESWKAAFRLLSEDVDSNKAGIRIKDIETWTSSKTSLLNQSSSQVFSQMSNGKDAVDFTSFKQFVLNSGYNDITAQLDQKVIAVPLNLTNLHL